MDYPYLNQTTFDPTNCSLAGMDPTLPNCSMAGTYADLGPCSQMSAAQSYRYGGMRSFPAAPNLTPATSCSMMPRPREHSQHSVFPSGELQVAFKI